MSSREGWIEITYSCGGGLISNLVETAKAYAARERSVFGKATQGSASSVAASSVDGQATAERALTGSLNRLMAVAEAYPQLTDDKSSFELQSQLANIEDQLQLSRR